MSAIIWPWLAGAAVIVAVLGGILGRHLTPTTTALPFEHIAMRRLTDSGRASRPFDLTGRAHGGHSAGGH